VPDALIEFEDVSYWYGMDTPSRVRALDGVSVDIPPEQIIGVVGHTGSGKSTLVQLMNALLLPVEGQVRVFKQETTSKGADLKGLRKRVGLVFQFPEHQLFEETVAQDVAFGPRQIGLTEEEITSRVERALRSVGLEPEEIGPRSPFELSGGQQRRVAIAGVLAMDPDVLILDEPLAGLDPEGKRSFEKRIRELHAERRLTVILVSHELDAVARLCDSVMVLHEGRVRVCDSPRMVFKQSNMLRDSGLELPDINRLMEVLRDRGLEVRTDVISVEEAAGEILAAVSKHGTA